MPNVFFRIPSVLGFVFRPSDDQFSGANFGSPCHLLSLPWVGPGPGGNVQVLSESVSCWSSGYCNTKDFHE